ncbi:MAG: phospholipid carrier-dependent glycosyltransferase [Calditrichaeota bacterium]|nr:MAG: phospholipid carrier-dependent glycosyltransferase [Calditrichota bacterium]
MRKTTQYFIITFGLFLTFRLIAFALSIDAFDDFMPRIRMAMKWIEAPYLMTDNTLVEQYGVLHVTFIGLGLLLWNDPLVTPRVVSLIMGLLTFFPFYIMCKEYFNRRIAYLSLFLLSFYTLHVKFSAVTGSESTFVFFMITALAYLFKYANDTQIKFLIISGFSLGLACLARYEGMLFIPLLPLLWLDTPRDFKDFFDFRSHLFQASMIFWIAVMIPVGLWMLGNYIGTGHPLPAMVIVEESHRLFNEVVKYFLGHKFTIIYFLAFIPGVLLITLTPPVFLGGLWGVLRIFKNRNFRTLFLINLFFMLTQLFSGKVILVRYTILSGVLMVPYAAYGFYSLYQRYMNGKAVRGLLLIAISSFTWIFAILAFERGPHSSLTERLWSVSPIGYMRPEVQQLIDYFNKDAADAKIIITDLDRHMRLRPMKLYAMKEGREIRQAYRGRHMNRITKSMETVLDDIVNFFKAEYIVSRRDTPLDKAMEQRAENPDFDPVLKARLVLSNQYYRIYKTEILTQLNTAGKL